MPEKTVAIVGASGNRSKFGNKSVRAHAHCGWTVYPVHPTLETIEGLPTFASLADVPQPLTRISLYVPSAIGARLAPDMANAAAEEIYVNPGAGGADLDAALEAVGLEVLHACSIVELGVSPSQFPD